MSPAKVRLQHIQQVHEASGRNVSETARRLNMHWKYRTHAPSLLQNTRLSSMRLTRRAGDGISRRMVTGASVRTLMRRRRAQGTILFQRVPIAPPFHPPGSNSDLHPPHGQALGQADEADEVIDAMRRQSQN